MKKQTNAAIEAHVIRGASYLLLLVAGTVMTFFGAEAPTKVLPRTLSFAERVAYQRAIEDVYWRHRIWPKENPNPKPSFDAVMPQAQLEKKVEAYLLNSGAVEDYYEKPLSAEQLQGEMERMARDTKQPEVLRELFDALGNDPFVIAECLARPVLAERMTTDLHVTQIKTGLLRPNVVAPSVNYTLPMIPDAVTGCTDDSWTATSTTNAPSPRLGHTAVWTGSEMIVWGGDDILGNYLNTGGRYTPSTDSWTATSTLNAASGRAHQSAIWTGTEMIVWGGYNSVDLNLNTGGRYNPTTNNWIATSTGNAPSGRSGHKAVWTGSEMIVWGGGDRILVRTGGRYDPSTDRWVNTSTNGAPPARSGHTAIWTGSEMIVWGGQGNIHDLRTGGRYIPTTDSWTATSTVNSPERREIHTAVWTGTEMIVWGGLGAGLDRTGGRYNPTSDSWIATTTTGAPDGRHSHTAVWTGSEMIVWGGWDGSYSNIGGKYDPVLDSWTSTSTTNVPDGRLGHKAVWTGSDMIVWGGYDGVNWFNTGGRYCAQTGSPTPTPGPIQLRGQGRKVGGINTSRLKWRGATSANIDVYRDGLVIATTPNDGLYDDSTGTTGQASFTYQVCEAGVSTCSNEVTVNFPP